MPPLQLPVQPELKLLGKEPNLSGVDPADMVIVGGTEALVKDYAIGGFVSMRALPVNYNDHPEVLHDLLM